MNISKITYIFALGKFNPVFICYLTIAKIRFFFQTSKFFWKFFLANL